MMLECNADFCNELKVGFFELLTEIIHFSFSGPEVSAADSPLPQYSVETLAVAVIAGSVVALIVGFISGYLCGRKCRKDEDDNLPYPDTEYEYFEQRQPVNR